VANQSQGYIARRAPATVETIGYPRRRKTAIDIYERHSRCKPVEAIAELSAPGSRFAIEWAYGSGIELASSWHEWKHHEQPLCIALTCLPCSASVRPGRMHSARGTRQLARRYGDVLNSPGSAGVPIVARLQLPGVLAGRSQKSEKRRLATIAVPASLTCRASPFPRRSSASQCRTRSLHSTSSRQAVKPVLLADIGEGWLYVLTPGTCCSLTLIV
jgi:hypothetical protein